MNATAPPDFIEVTDYHDGSDSDTNIDDADEYYQPVSAVDSEDEDLQNDNASTHPQLPLNNGATVIDVQRGISALRLNGDVNPNAHDASSDDEDEEAAGQVAAAESAMMRAIREDENRRRAPMTAENRTRVLEAMRGIPFAGAPPSWARRVAVDDLRARLRSLERSSRN